MPRLMICSGLILSNLLLFSCQDNSARHELDSSIALPDVRIEASQKIEAAVVDLMLFTPDYGLVTSCAAINSVDCFSNGDCPTGKRCQNLGDESSPVACCVPGLRGPKAAGEQCQTENDCASAVCVSKNAASYCSVNCQQDEDCPEGMKYCVLVGDNSSNYGKWCFPTN